MRILWTFTFQERREMGRRAMIVPIDVGPPPARLDDVISHHSEAGFWLGTSNATATSQRVERLPTLLPGTDPLEA